MNTPNIIPSGYADEREPNDAPSGSEKCSPKAGWMGDAIVKPKRFRKDARRTAGIERSLVLDRALTCFADCGVVCTSPLFGEGEEVEWRYVARYREHTDVPRGVHVVVPMPAIMWLFT